MVERWETAIIGDYLDFKNGLNKAKEFFGYGTPIVNYMDVYHNRSLVKKDINGRVSLSLNEINRFNIKKGDVFFTRTSETPEEVGISSVLLEDIEDGVFSGFVLRGRPKNYMFLSEYCRYCFSEKSIRESIIRNCTYTTRALTNGKQLSAIRISVPPKPEQKAISSALFDIDSLIDNLEKLVEKKKNIKQGAMQELLTGKRRLPGFDGEWTWKTLQNISCMFAGGTPDSKNHLYYGGDIPWVSIADISLSGKYLSETERCLSNLGLENSSARLFPENTLLLAMYASIGKCCIAKKQVSSSQAILGLYSFQEANLDYVYYCLCLIHNKLVEMGQTGTQSNLSKKIIESIQIQLPFQVEEQEAIASILSDMDNEIEELEKKLAKYRNIKQGMMSELLSGHIRLTEKEGA